MTSNQTELHPASMCNGLHCQSRACRAFGDKELFSEVSKLARPP